MYLFLNLMFLIWELKFDFFNNESIFKLFFFSHTTALCEAVKYHDIEIIKLLLAHKDINIDVKDLIFLYKN